MSDLVVSSVILQERDSIVGFSPDLTDHTTASRWLYGNHRTIPHFPRGTSGARNQVQSSRPNAPCQVDGESTLRLLTRCGYMYIASNSVWHQRKRKDRKNYASSLYWFTWGRGLRPPHGLRLTQRPVSRTAIGDILQSKDLKGGLYEVCQPSVGSEWGSGRHGPLRRPRPRCTEATHPGGCGRRWSQRSFEAVSVNLKQISTMTLSEFVSKRSKNIFEPLGIPDSSLPRPVLLGRKGRIRSGQGDGPKPRQYKRSCGARRCVRAAFQSRHHDQGGAAAVGIADGGQPEEISWC